ncbi:MAG: DUF4476 domain-containing protein [Bacteroidota bacterium]
MIKAKANFLLLFILLVPALLSAQLNHFIYLQTEGKQPFYAKLDKKIFSSSASGYLIIPKLKDGQYNIIVGFPKSENKEQTYPCNIDNKDAGYLIKNFGEKGWGLFNLQTLDVVMAGSNAVKTEVVKSEKTDDFSNMLSEVVNDPSIKQQEKAPAKQKEEVTAVVKEDKIVVHKVGRSTIIKQNTITNENGVVVTYIDITGDKQDTIQILLPMDTAKANVEVISPVQEVKSIEDPKAQVEKEPIVTPKEDNIVQVKEEPKQDQKKGSDKADKKFLPIEVKAAPNTDAVIETSPVVQMINSDCKSNATEEDFLKLRKKMASADTEDEMLTTAQKFFKVKCYTTEHVKNLSVLFLKDAGKYKFFDLAYPFVSDSSNFSTLENQLTDTYYISRFKAMVRH